MLVLYAVTLAFQAITTASILEQGSVALLILTAIHAGVVAAFFWTLLGTALVATQVCKLRINTWNVHSSVCSMWKTVLRAPLSYVRLPASGGSC